MAVAVLFLVTAFGGATLAAVGYLGMTEKLPRNHFAGIRLPYTMASEENWRVVHREAGPIMVLGAVAVLSSSLAFIPFALAGVIPTGLATGVVIGQAVVMVFASIVSARKGIAQAKKLAAKQPATATAQP